MKRDICTIEEAMDVFAEGARLHHTGMFFRSDKMMFDGLYREAQPHPLQKQFGLKALRNFGILK